MEYKPADDTDKFYFRELNEACYRDLVTRQFGSWNSALQLVGFDVKWQTHRFSKIIIGGQVVGGVWVDDLDDFRQLREIQIHPDYQSQGIGTRVVQDVIDRSRNMRKTLRLKVLHQNRAISLYRRLGFEVIDDTGVQYVMEWKAQ